MIPHRGGLPHSDIHGSTPARGSPWLFAACHVLHRLLVPRHPPNALITLDNHGPILADQSFPPCTGAIHTQQTGPKLGPGCRSSRSHGKTLLSIHTWDPSASRPTDHHNAPERSCLWSRAARSRKIRLPVRLATADAPRDAPEPDSLFQRTWRPANRTPNGTITPGPRMRCLRQFPEHVTFSVTTRQDPSDPTASASTPSRA